MDDFMKQVSLDMEIEQTRKAIKMMSIALKELLDEGWSFDEALGILRLAMRNGS